MAKLLCKRGTVEHQPHPSRFWDSVVPQFGISPRRKATGNSFKSKSKSTQSRSLDQAQSLLAKSGSSTGTPPPTPGSKRLTGSSSLDTPLRPTSDGPKSGHRTVAAMTPLLEAEIKGTTQHVDPGFFNRVVKKRARRTGIDDISIAQFIQNSGLYNSDAKQWNNITKTTVEKDLYPHFLKIFQQVVATFHVKEREVIATFNIKIKHIEGSLGDSKLKTSPDLFFYGSGPNFHPEGLQLELKDKADYRYCASPCEIKTEHNLSEEGVVTQVGVYARQCFIQQGNRHYVYSLVMTEKRVFLLQFDRNGILRGEYVDIHENPVDFVYLILLVSSPNCTTLGFDTSVYWKGDKRYIKTLNEDGKRVEYEIINSEPFFQRRTIRGRGTLCWLGRDPRGILRIIKDSWQAQGRNPEADLLEELKGVPGVGQMIAFEPEKLTIAGLRGMNDKALPSGMVDRLFRRIILKAYGNQIEDFANSKQFLYAFRDAVAGHKSMWDMNIIHRDISINNILIGEEGAEEGWRGVVIDMDMAVRWQREHTMAAVDFRTGTRAFQALLVIGSEQDKAKGVVILPHDHMDDLESFFYVFSWVCMGRNQYGQPVKCAVLEHWEGDNLQDVFVHKENFLVSKSVNPKHDEVIHNFGPIFQNLFDGLRVLVRDNYFWKDNNRDKIPRTLAEMKPRSDKDYAAFLGLINEALERLEEQERKEEGQNEDRMQHLLAEGRPISPDDPSSSPTQSPASSPTRAPSRSHQQTGSSSSMKRTRDERDAGVTEMDIDGEETLPASKRLQTRSLSQSQPEEVLVRAVQEAIAGAAPEAAPAPRRSSRLRTGSSQSVPANIEPAPAPMARRQPTRSRNGSRSTQPTEVPVNGAAPSSNGTGSRSRNGSTDSGGRRTTSRGGTSGSRSRRQSAGSTGLRRGRSASRKNKN